ncbi:MAG: hypothetical protein R3B54_14010 [Bdellovibrionota bacterium]
MAPDYDKQMESQALKLADNYIMELLYGLTDPVTMEKNKALPGVGKKVKLEAGRTKALISVYKDIKHPFLKEKSAIFRKLFGEPPAIELSDAEKKLPKAEQDKILSDKRVKRSTNLRDERIEALSTNFDELLKETGLFVAPK